MNNVRRDALKHLIEHQIAVLTEYKEFIDSSADEEMPELPLLPFHSPRIYIERDCPLRNQGDGNLEMLTTPGERKEGLKEIRDFTRDADSLIIVDPYFFSGKRGNAKQIAEDLKKSARIGGASLRRVHIVCDNDNTTNAVRNAIFEMAEENNVQVTVNDTKEVHDRVWIADRDRALLVGTSLGGIGNRAAFLIPLPNTDLAAMLEFLDGNGLSRAAR